jgi:hypothetical protein
MRVTGLGAPDSVRVHFRACEVDVLVDVLCEHRAQATRDAAETYATVGAGGTRAVDDRHDRLRSVDALLMQLEDQPHTGRGAVLLGETEVMCDVVHDGAREALRRLGEAHEHYEDRSSPQARDVLLDAAKTAGAWAATLTGFDRVDRGWEQ